MLFTCFLDFSVGARVFVIRLSHMSFLSFSLLIESPKIVRIFRIPERYSLPFSFTMNRNKFCFVYLVYFVNKHAFESGSLAKYFRLIGCPEKRYMYKCML